MTDAAYSAHPPQTEAATPDVAMAQVRDLLFGDVQRRLLDRINHLEDRLRETDRRLAQAAAETDRRLRDLDAETDRRLRELDARGEERRRRTLSDISANLAQMSEDLRALAETPPAEAAGQGEGHG
ncbi:hypothetical protein [Neomegalonema sp.]|uniref:hypothetical protein n=1 Tax=Neomegalonema sp. TaxID=2039713 RepID=UPI00261E4E44|nr:hypothetical protein [Neomegalonema sp.]MDD2869032.1 hypothetical protein [Neomegalonema sp.]